MNKDLIISKYKELVEHIDSYYPLCDTDELKTHLKIRKRIESEILSLLQEQEKEPEIDIEFFRVNILRHLSTEDMITLRNWLNSYESVDQSGIRECEHPYVFVYRKGDYEKCSKCGKILCEG